MKKSTIGIDISKNDFTVAIYQDEKYKNYKFVNTDKGFKELLKAVKSSGIIEPLFCMEATGAYGEQLADYIYNNGFKVSVVNPFQIKSFARTLLKRHKTDEVDSKIIALYAYHFFEELLLYKPKPRKHKELQELSRLFDLLQQDVRRHKNRLEKEECKSKSVIRFTKRIIKTLEGEILLIEKKLREIVESEEPLLEKFNLLKPIKGIGDKTIITILAELPDLSTFNNARGLAAFCGLSPRHYNSGTSVNRASRISKVGSHRLRKSLYFPAIVAKNNNEALRDFVSRLEKNGKKPKVIVVAVMRKLVHIIFGILKHNQPFRPELV